MKQYHFKWWIVDYAQTGDVSLLLIGKLSVARIGWRLSFKWCK